MFIGINLIAPQDLSNLQHLSQSGEIDFCELIVDNFIHISPEKIRRSLSGLPLGLHVVNSCFIERDDRNLKALAEKIRPWIHAINPIYVSDHLVKNQDEAGQQLPFPLEVDYQNVSFIEEKVLAWQNYLDHPLLLENHASLIPNSNFQSNFFATLKKKTGVDLLFDFSNAYIADYNGVLAKSAWQSLVNDTRYFHVSGFRLDNATGFAIDTHDTPIADEVIQFMEGFAELFQQKNHLVIETTADFDISSWRKERTKILSRIIKNNAG